MLASVQAIATQTLRYNTKPADFASAFSGRVQSLARAHSLLSDATWHGAQLNDLILDQLRLGTVDEERLTASGPEVNLTPALALHFGLILHELCTNANKYGALSTATGRIAVGWSIENGLLHLTWIESGGPAVKAPSRRGFGTTLIEQSVKAEGGKAQASYRADGLTWDITLKLPESSATQVAFDSKGRQSISDAGEQVRLVNEAVESLAGVRLLVIEDETLVALDIVSVLEDAGAAILGPAATAEQALKFIAAGSIDGALLDGNLNGHPVDEVAAALTRENIPFLFVSGYGAESLPRAFANAPALSKPFLPEALVVAVTELIAPRADIVHIRSNG
jgi:two-component sensor histidine kinase